MLPGSKQVRKMLGGERQLAECMSLESIRAVLQAQQSQFCSKRFVYSVLVTLSCSAEPKSLSMGIAVQAVARSLLSLLKNKINAVFSFVIPVFPEAECWECWIKTGVTSVCNRRYFLLLHSSFWSQNGWKKKKEKKQPPFPMEYFILLKRKKSLELINQFQQWLRGNAKFNGAQMRALVLHSLSFLALPQGAAGVHLLWQTERWLYNLCPKANPTAGNSISQSRQYTLCRSSIVNAQHRRLQRETCQAMRNSYDLLWEEIFCCFSFFFS